LTLPLRLLTLLLALTGCVEIARDVVEAPDALPADARPMDLGPALDQAVAPVDAGARADDAGATPPDAAVDAAPACGDCRPGELRDCGLAVGVCDEAQQRCVDGCWTACPGLADLRDERCNTIDDDCDGRTDEGLGLGEACQTGVGGCAQQGVFVCRPGGDVGCTAAPGLPSLEICNGVDDDCDGAIDDGLDCPDCLPDEVCNGLDDDCDDTIDEGVSNACGQCGPVPPEQCNGSDDDCDGETDEGLLNACGQCGPVPLEQCNGLDDDCDGQIDEGVRNACGHCGAVPNEACNNADDDCDGQTDEGVRNACGQCGAVPNEACNDLDDDCDDQIDEGGVCAGRAERCDGLDQDADGRVDEDLTRTCGVSNVGACRTGTETCESGDWAPCVGDVRPRSEACNNADDDCDGSTDEGISQLCGSDVGRCRIGGQTCQAGVFGACLDAIAPRAEICDGVDDDCDGTTDEGVLNACGLCGPAPDETCNSIDDDCDGRIDERLSQQCGSDIGTCRPGLQQCADGRWSL
jgi:hypothetical protein